MSACWNFKIRPWLKWFGTWSCACWFIAWQDPCVCVCVCFECCYRTGMEIKTSCHCCPSIPQFKGSQLHSAWQEASHSVYLLREERDRGICVEHFIMKEEQPDCCRQVLKVYPTGLILYLLQMHSHQATKWRESPLLCSTAVKIVNTLLPQLLWEIQYLAFKNMNLQCIWGLWDH